MNHWVKLTNGTHNALYLDYGVCTALRTKWPPLLKKRTKNFFLKKITQPPLQWYILRNKLASRAKIRRQNTFSWAFPPKPHVRPVAKNRSDVTDRNTRPQEGRSQFWRHVARQRHDVTDRLATSHLQTERRGEHTFFLSSKKNCKISDNI